MENVQELPDGNGLNARNNEVSMAPLPAVPCENPSPPKMAQNQVSVRWIATPGSSMPRENSVVLADVGSWSLGVGEDWAWRSGRAGAANIPGKGNHVCKCGT